jgi:hypothetical protein
MSLVGRGGPSRAMAIFREPSPSQTQPDLTQDRPKGAPQRALSGRPAPRRRSRTPRGVGSPRQVISADTPPLGVPSWTTWSVGYTVPRDSADVGKPLGFAARVSIDGDAYTIGFDNLRITYDAVPEPTSAVVLATAAVPLLLLRTRRRN